MRRKRINNQVDICCEMFSGWRLVNDMDTLLELKAGQIAFDFLAKTAKLNDEMYGLNFNMLNEIADWFDKDLTDNNMEKTSIISATLLVDFISSVTDGKPKSKTKKIIAIKLKMRSTILTDEKKYLADKEKTMEYHYIDRKKDKTS